MEIEDYFSGKDPVSVLISNVWVTIDREDVPTMIAFPWGKSGAGLKKGKQYIQGRVEDKGAFIYLHRFLNKTPKGMLTDHIDNNALNNRKDNLRSVTVSQNNMNSKLKKENTSGYRGVTFRKDTGKWQAQINKDGKYRNLGSFLTKEAAFSAYLAKAEEMFGEFARYANGEVSEWVKKQ